MSRPWAAARRILAVRPDNLGDVLMTTPALAAVKATSPGTHLSLLTSPAGASIAPHLSMVDEVIVHDVPWTKGSGSRRSAESDRRLIELLRSGHFDAAILFTVCTQSALPAAFICRLAGIPLRLAYCRENPYDLLTDWRRDSEVIESGMRHEVIRQLDLVRSVGFTTIDDDLRFDVLNADRQGAHRHLANAGVDMCAPYVVVHPGASASSRRYPADRLGLAGREIADASGCRIVIVGSESERSLVDEAAAAFGGGAVTQTGVLSLGELAAVIAGAQLMVCNNSGPMHLAAAVGTPVVALYALTNPQHTPWRVLSEVLNHDVACRNCLQSTCPMPHHACLREVTVSEVAEAALRLLRQARCHESAVSSRVPA